MDELVIGETRIPVTVRSNGRLKSSRLSVNRGGVLVEVPSDFPHSKLADLVERQKEWVFSQWEDVRHKRPQTVWPEEFNSGAKVMFLGRMNLITVNQGSADRISYSARGFEVDINSERKSIGLKPLFIEFFQSYLSELLDELIAAYPKFSGFVDLRVQFTHRKDCWAYCDEQQVIHLGWDLAVLPKKLIEYVLIHELCHILHRNHSEDFWATLQSVLPDYDLRRRQLTEFEAQIEI